MNRDNAYILLTLLLVSLFTSCQQADFGSDEAGESSIESSDENKVNITVQTSMSDDFRFVTSKAADAGTMYANYLFKPDNTCFKGYQGSVSDNIGSTFSTTFAPGTYTAVSLVGYAKGEGYATAGLTPTSVLSLPKTLHNIYLGQKSVVVDEDENNYSVSVTATRLMAVLSVSITNVPTNVTSVSVVLPAQASQFTLKGDVKGNETSQTISLTKGEQTTDASGTYFTWAATDQIIYPSADGCTEMPVHVVIGYKDNTQKTLTSSYKETDKTCCTRGTKTTLSARMPTNISSVVSLDESFIAENTGTFPLTTE